MKLDIETGIETSKIAVSKWRLVLRLKNLKGSLKLRLSRELLLISVSRSPSGRGEGQFTSNYDFYDASKHSEDYLYKSSR